MTTVAWPTPAPAPAGVPAGAAPAPAAHRLARVGLLADLERPRQAFEMLTPNWFASVMGTGIVAVGAARLPVRWPGLHALAVGSWALAVAMLVALLAGTAVHWRLYPANARSHASHPVMAHFYGAPPMAVLTVGAATLLAGAGVVGRRGALDIDWVLWGAGTLAGLVAAVAVPYLTFTRHGFKADGAFGGWLMPIVPPMVSASTGALLVPHAPAGQARIDLLWGCYALCGVSLVASMIVIALIWHRLAVHNAGEARLVPTLWIVLGPLGQSVTAATLLGADAHLAVPAGDAALLQALGVVYGMAVLGVAVTWAVIAGAVTVRTARDHLPFSLAWWSFTFPVGTCVTGTIGLAVATGSALLRGASLALFAALVAAWILVAARTACGVARGRLLLAAAGGPAQRERALPRSG